MTQIKTLSMTNGDRMSGSWLSVHNWSKRPTHASRPHQSPRLKVISHFLGLSTTPLLLVIPFNVLFEPFFDPLHNFHPCGWYVLVDQLLFWHSETKGVR